MQQPRNRQEFMRMQEQAVAAARDMQRRATLPVPKREAEPSLRKSFGSAGPPDRRQEEPQFRQAPPPPPRRPEGLHHARPGRRQEAGGRRQEQPGYTTFRPVQQPPAPPPPPRPAPAPSPPSASMPPLTDLLKLFGNLGGGNASTRQEPHQAPQGSPTAPPGDTPSGEGMDSILPLLLLLLLKKDNADQGLLMALMYILM